MKPIGYKLKALEVWKSSLDLPSEAHKPEGGHIYSSNVAVIRGFRKANCFERTNM
jgi:hypothetical protein